MNRVIRFLEVLCLSGVALAGCADSSTITAEQNVEDITANPQAVSLRFVHGSPTSPAVDIYLGASATPLWTAVAFGTATPYAAVAPDGLQLVLRTAGAAATDAPLFTSDPVVAQLGDVVTTFAGGVLGSSLATSKFRVTAYTEAFAEAQRGQAVVRFVQDSHGVAAAGFDLGADGTFEVPSIDPFTASAPEGVVVTVSHQASVQLAVAGGTPAKALTAFTLPREVLARRGGTFLALVGVPTFVPNDPRGLALLAIGPASATIIRQNPTVYVLPTIPDSTGIDIHAFGIGLPVRTVAENLGFGKLAPALQVAPSAFGYGLFVRNAAAGTSSFPGLPLAVELTGPLVAGERYLVIASGFSDPTCTTGRSHVRLTMLHDGFDRTVTATGRLRAVAAAADAPAVDVGQFAPSSDAPFTSVDSLANLAYPSASAEAGAVVSSGPLNPGVQLTGTTTALRFNFGALTVLDRVFGIVAGAFVPTTGDIQSRFIIVKTPASGLWTAQTLSPRL